MSEKDPPPHAENPEGLGQDSAKSGTPRQSDASGSWHPDEKRLRETATRRKLRRYSLFVLLALVVLGILVQRCWQPLPPPPEMPTDTLGIGVAPPPAIVETLAVPAPETVVVTPPKPQPKPRPKPPKPVVEPVVVDTPQGDTTTPYVYADPWGGRHFDSVTVHIVCRESCVVLYSLNDTLQFHTYDEPLTFRRNTTLWIAGVRGDGTRLDPLRVDYVIDRNRGHCPEDMVSFESDGQEICMDKFEWPNREDAAPQAFVTWQEAKDSCARVGKRLCSLAEWQTVCMGPEQARYPYAARYDERYCPAKEGAPVRSGHFPVCRSYYGSYDMTGNLWEWTATPHPEREGFYQVAGGNWSAGDQATCKFTRYSFYPQNRFPMVGFRCCEVAEKSDAKK